MKTNVWLKRKITIFIGGDPVKNQPPEITLEIDNPQLSFDSDKYTIQITETK